ncbi:MAG: DUF5991 domain-containing protein [Ruminococcus flavefaciens]|nr:DUF5991 domain-containing protein [Ruminococcus flavefaciens]
MEKERTQFRGMIAVILFMILIVGIYILRTVYEGKQLDGWIGKYVFTDSFEHNSGEINYYVDYEIIIYQDDGRYYAELEGNGWFLQTRSLAYIEGDKNSIDIIFKSTLPGDSLYEYAERYETDELMLTLSYDDSELISTWYALRMEHPVFIESTEEIRGCYFKKEINENELDTWLGAYSYCEFYKFDNENIQADFELIIYKDDDNYYAEFKNSGYSLRKKDFSLLLQSRSLAYIKGNEKSIDIYFKKTLPGDSLYGTAERYKRNELLLTLTCSDSELQSAWYALQAEEPVLSGSGEEIKGVYFTEN